MKTCPSLLISTSASATLLRRPQFLPAVQPFQNRFPERPDTILRGGFMTNIADVVQQLQKERDQAARTVEQLDAALAALAGTSGRRAGRRGRLSAAARERIAAAQRARWAKARANGGQKQNVVAMPKKKTMSAAARRKIAAAQKARWAKVKAAQKKSA
jgi:predicted transcriptional regulator